MHQREVREVMTTPVVSVVGGTGFKEIVALMTEHHVSGLPVLDDDGDVIGIVTESDLLYKQRQDERPPTPFASRERRTALKKEAGTTAADLMSAPVVAVGPDTTLAAAARLLTDRKVKRFPVVENGKLVGILSRADVLGVFLRSDDELRDDVMHGVFEHDLCVDPTAVGVEVHEGVVRLRGQLETRSLVPIAVAMTRRVIGVVDVIDELSYDRDDRGVSPTGPPSARRATWLD